MTEPSMFQKLLSPIKKKIFFLIGRAILTAIDNSGKIQKIQVTGLKNETISDVENVQQYGFESYPKTDNSEAIILFLNGNREHGICVVVHDRENRPIDLSEGDVCVYDYRGSRITFNSDGVEVLVPAGKKIMASDGVTMINILTHAHTGVTGPPISGS